ncbi:RNA recognition motif domain-containing protein [Ditylenchus destructor]|nr:RNA recognition motif domain-containing protein [Ditylenchus destructor]
MNYLLQFINAAPANVPIDSYQLAQKHQQCRKTAVEPFEERVQQYRAGTLDYDFGPACEQLNRDIKAAYNSFVNQNNLRTEKIQATKAAEDSEKKRREAERAAEKANMATVLLRTYNSLMEEFINAAPANAPIDSNQLSQKHQECRKTAVEPFEERVQQYRSGTIDYDFGPALEQLNRDIMAAYNSFVNQNNLRTEKIQAKKAAEDSEKKRLEAELEAKRERDSQQFKIIAMQVLRMYCGHMNSICRHHLPALTCNPRIEHTRIRSFSSLSPSESLDEPLDMFEEKQPQAPDTSSIFDPDHRYDRTRTIVVSDLSHSSTKESFYAYFRDFGIVTGCRIIEKLPPAKNIGFVEFATVQEAENTMLFSPHIIDGREVFPVNDRAGQLLANHRLIFDGLSKETTTDEVRRYFSTYGDVLRCHIMRDEENASRGFGFVVFRAQSSITRMLSSPTPHVIDGKEILMEQLFKTKRRQLLDDKVQEETKEYKIYVGSLWQELSSDDLRQYFSKFGQIVSCDIERNEDNSSRGFAYVTFDSKEAVDQVLELGGHNNINGRMITVTSVNPTADSARTLVYKPTPTMPSVEDLKNPKKFPQLNDRYRGLNIVLENI